MEEKQPWHLVHLCQRLKESLKRFLTRFITEACRIPQLFDEMKLNAIIATFSVREFFKHLAHQYPKTFREAEAIARAYISTKEANETKRPKCVDCPTVGPVVRKKRNKDDGRF
ncbi:hypothetical protein Nepgr_026689 [Nepenthes gracilis]|uniref:Uncharacterized protein n=1 Tax=Nepenthes gracilis TaxID=150966 RepID=A0AAD3TA76_NEPGR|nr:hypothetical protein Nepgr_026689 [Nepenthes gracilis]